MSHLSALSILKFGFLPGITNGDSMYTEGKKLMDTWAMSISVILSSD